MQIEIQNDPAAERAVLSGIFTYGVEAYVEVSDLVTIDSFTIDSNQAFYKCLCHIFQDGEDIKLDIPTILSAANSIGIDGFYDDSEKKHLRALTNMPVERTNIRKLAAKIRKLEIARLLSGRLYEGQEELCNISGDEPIETILNIAESKVFDFTSLLAKNSNGPERIGDGIRNYIKYLAENPVDQIGISTGWKEYDKAIGGGLRPKTINVIASRPKGGKSQAANNICLNVAKQNVPVLYLDTEMSKEDQWQRMVGNLSGVLVNEIENGKFGFDKIKKQKVANAVAQLEKIKYDYQSIAGKPFEDIIGLMRRWVIKDVGLNEDGTAKPCMIAFDYLKLMSSEGLSNDLKEFQLLGFMMTALHNFAVKYSIPILLFIQLNRDGINTEDTSAASGSDRIIWLCSNFSILKTQTPEELSEQFGSKIKYTRKLIPIISRHGPGMKDGDFIHMNAEYQFGRITEGPTRNNLAKGDSKGFTVENTTNDVEFG